MTQLSDDCFAFSGGLMPADEARRILGARVACVTEAETVPLADALGRILAEDVRAGIDLPPYNNAAVDGFAFRHGDLATGGETRLRLAGRATAGHPFTGTVPTGGAIRILTGAAMPAALDTVIMEEDVTEENGVIIIPPCLKAGANRRRAGENIAAGSRALTAGTRLKPQHIGHAASLGFDTLKVFRRLRVAVFSTGDELREPGTALGEGLIYDCNRHMLCAMAAHAGASVRDFGILPDDTTAIREALVAAAREHDILVTSAGISASEEDHVKPAIAAADGALHFWRIAVKPGRPLALGQIGGAAFAGLPGNPVAAFATFLMFVRPMMAVMNGAAATPPRLIPANAAFAMAKKPGREEWLRARLEREGPRLVAHRYPRQGSGILTSVVESDGLVILPADRVAVKEGDMVDFLSFNEADA